MDRLHRDEPLGCGRIGGVEQASLLRSEHRQLAHRPPRRVARGCLAPASDAQKRDDDRRDVVVQMGVELAAGPTVDVNVGRREQLDRRVDERRERGERDQRVHVGRVRPRPHKRAAQERQTAPELDRHRERRHDPAGRDVVRLGVGQHDDRGGQRDRDQHASQPVGAIARLDRLDLSHGLGR